MGGLEYLLCLRKDSGAIKFQNLLSGLYLHHQIFDLKAGQRHECLLPGLGGSDLRRGFPYAGVILWFGPERKGNVDHHIPSKPVIGVIVLPALEFHPKVRIVL